MTSKLFRYCLFQISLAIVIVNYFSKRSGWAAMIYGLRPLLYQWMVFWSLVIVAILSGFQGYDLRIGHVDRLSQIQNYNGRSHLQDNLKDDRRSIRSRSRSHHNNTKSFRQRRVTSVRAAGSFLSFRISTVVAKK